MSGRWTGAEASGLPMRMARSDEVFLQHLGDAVGQGAHAVGTEAQRASAADAGELAGDVRQALAGLHRGGLAQDVGDEAADGFADRGGVGAGFGGVDEDLEGLTGVVLVDGDESLAEGVSTE